MEKLWTTKMKRAGFVIATLGIIVLLFSLPTGRASAAGPSLEVGSTDIATESSLFYIVSPQAGATYNVGDKITLKAYAGVYYYSYYAGFLLNGAPNFIYFRITKDGKRVLYDRASYTGAGSVELDPITLDKPGKYLVEIDRTGYTYKVVDGGIVGTEMDYENFEAIDQVEINVAASIARAEVETIPNKTYTGKAITPTPTVKIGSTKLVKGKDYTLSYSGNKAVGTATIVIKGAGVYSGTKKVSFKIVPKATSLGKPSAGSKSFTAKWKRLSAPVSGYQLQYSTLKNFKAGKSTKTVNVPKNKISQKTINKLKAKKRYYMRVRTYAKVGSAKYYSNWSKTKTVKTK